ncbi:MAG: TIGR00282 family metallophosphoesterase [Rhodospirillales bacterium]|nr:TIGR00282 family metallophosphoesterase [Rhodospirillales bacterium]
MRILMVGDVVGKAGRDAISAHLPLLRESLKLDFVVVNGENAAHGFGITDKICASLYQQGADVITTGNHIWDQRPIMNYIDSDPKLLRPLNFPAGTPGAGYGIFAARDGRRVMVINAMGRLYMDPLDDPFAAIENLLASHKLQDDIAAIVVDFHGEATSEKQAIAHILDGRVSAVVGTHTHVPTADYRILPGGSAYQSDLGMTGDYDSVIGMKKKDASARFTTKLPQARLEPAEGEGTLSGLLIETDDESGLALRASPVRVGGCLTPSQPQF